MENWATYYSELYDSPDDYSRYGLSDLINLPTNRKVNTIQLNTDLTISEIIRSIDSLNDYSTPESDNILIGDFTILLHLEPEQKSADNVEGWIIKDFIWRVISEFWRKYLKNPPRIKKKQF